MAVRDELYRYREDLPQQVIDQLVENGDLLEAAEWHSRPEGMHEAAFYASSRMYIWNQVQAEEARIKGGDFDRMLAMLEKIPKPEKEKGLKVLDFGAGIGSVGIYLLDNPDACGYVPYFYEICGTSAKFLDRRLKTRAHVMGNMGNRIININEPWKGFFDLVIAYAVFEHMNTDALNLTLGRIGEILKPNGTLFMLNYHDTFGGRWPMHHLMSPMRQDLFDSFAKKHRVIAPRWEDIEGEA